MNDPDDRAKVEALNVLLAIRHEERGELTAVIERLLRPLDVPMPAVTIAHLGTDLGQFSLGDGVIDTPTITLASHVLDGRAWWAHPEVSPLGYRIFLGDLLKHEVAHHVARVMSERGDGLPLTKAKHGWPFVRACATLCVAHRRSRHVAGFVPPVASPRASGWPVSQRSAAHYMGAIDARFLDSVAARREPLT